MPIRIDHAAAIEILYEESELVADGHTDDLTDAWRSRVDYLGELCPYRKSSTFVAALGTAILAKTVEPAVDVFSLLDRDGGDTAYSARSLADDVWAKNRAYLRVDLGANGANPLNNTPFIGRSRIDAIENVRNKDGFEHLTSCLNDLSELTSVDDARAALRGFLYSRTLPPAVALDLGDGAGDHLIAPELARIAEEFVRTDSEEGRRAQAVAAGMLSLAFGEDVVEVGHVNDPDRNYPLDITVFEGLGDDKTVRLSVEVKDKPIAGSDVLSSVEKVQAFELQNILYMAVAQRSGSTNFSREDLIARDMGCRIVYCFSWVDLCSLCLAVTTKSGPAAVGVAYRAIGQRIGEIGVSDAGVQQWLSWQRPSS